MENEKRIKALMTVHTLEQTLGELYVQFAGRFPEHGPFWLRLAQEEDGHANAVRRLYQLSYEGRATFEEGTIRLEALESILAYVREQAAAAKASGISAVRALALTHDLETSLIERGIFSHFRVSREFAAVLEMLKRETLEHIQLAKSELERAKGRA